MSKSLLVTGAAGFIGANFAYYWMRDHPNFSFVHADICDYDRVLQTMREHAVDTVVNFAAESHVDRSITGPDAFIETNIVGTHSLLKAAREVWLGGSGMEHRFHHVSTDEV